MSFLRPDYPELAEPMQGPTHRAEKQDPPKERGREARSMAVGVPVVHVTEQTPWQSRASCLGTDPNLFFPERGASTKEAKAACKGCVVREDCLEFALQNGEKFGIWGGLSERERRRVRRQRALERTKSGDS